MATSKKVLFICVHNSARSQMAEAYFNALAPEGYAAESAGLEPTSVDPFAIEVLREDGIDISHKTTQSVFDLFREGRLYYAVITVCESGAEMRCPIFPGVAYREHWPFANPADEKGTDTQKIDAMRRTRDAISTTVESFIRTLEDEKESDED